MSARTLYDEIQEIRALYPRLALGDAAGAAARAGAVRLALARGVPRGRRRARRDARVLHGGRVLLRHVPPEARGRHLVEVCTNISCALVGAQQVLEAFEAELGVRAGETTDDGEVTLRTVECPGGCGWARSSPSTTATASGVTADDVPAIVAELRDGGDRCDEQIVLAGRRGAARSTKLADYRDGRRLRRRSRRRARWSRTQVVEELLDVEPARPRRRRSSRPAARRASSPKGTGKPTYLVVNADESEPGTFKDREIMFRVPHRLLEGCLITAHAIECDHVFIYIRGEYLGRVRGPRRRARGGARRPELLGDVTIVLHRGAGAYICGEETALLESLEGKRGQPRTKPPFPAVAGLYASPTPDQQRRDDRDRAEDRRARRRRVREDRRAARLVGHARLLALRQRRQRRQLRAADRASRCAS